MEKEGCNLDIGMVVANVFKVTRGQQQLVFQPCGLTNLHRKEPALLEVPVITLVLHISCTTVNKLRVSHVAANLL
jgi:hypothetical protein